MCTSCIWPWIAGNVSLKVNIPPHANMPKNNKHSAEPLAHAFPRVHDLMAQFNMCEKEGKTAKSGVHHHLQTWPLFTQIRGWLSTRWPTLTPFIRAQGATVGARERPHDPRRSEAEHSIHVLYLASVSPSCPWLIDGFLTSPSAHYTACWNSSAACKKDLRVSRGQ